MRQRRHIPADRMQVSQVDCIQLSLFSSDTADLISTFGTRSLPQVTVIDRSDSDCIDAQPADSVAKPVLNSRNYRLSAELLIDKTSPERIRANITAGRLAKQLVGQKREATTNEKNQLALFSGWGGLSSVFDEENRYASVINELLTTEERQAAAASCLTAFYTPPTVSKAIWQAIKQFGFTGGRVLEPGAGIGYFIGLSPAFINEQTSWVGVEKDPIAGQIFQLLYPDATIEIGGFEQADLAYNSFDLVIGNIPFGAYSVYDRHNPDLSAYPIHNYFIGKSARLVKPGGLLALITSSGTLDQSDTKFRQWLSRDAETELIGAIRLPSCAFENYTGTSVTADVLFLQRRSGINRQFAGHSFERTASIRSRTAEQDSEPLTSNLTINEYFISRPDMMLGQMVWADEVGKGGLYRADRPTLYLSQPDELTDRLGKAINQLPEKFLSATAAAIVPGLSEIDSPVQFTGVIRIKGRTYSQATIIQKYVRLRDALTALLTAERNDQTDSEVSSLRGRLNALYDEFTAFFGFLTGNRQLSFLGTFDNQFARVQALEVPEKNEGKVWLRKATIFRERVATPLPYPTSAASIGDAVNLSNWFHGNLNLSVIAQWLSLSDELVTDQLLTSGLSFLDPLMGCLIGRDAYLSGNVRQKLRVAEEKARYEPRYQANVYALQQVIPPTVPLALISFGLGSVWLPDILITSFIRETLQLPELTARYNKRSQQYELDTPAHFYSSLNQSLGTSHRTALQLIEAALNSRSVVITKTITQDGKEPQRRTGSVRDVEATSQAIAAQERLNELFVDFARQHDEVGIEEAFNQLYNAYIPRRFNRPSTSHYLNANPAITLREHQFRAVERIKLQDTMLAHAVGSGKTFTMITGAMELKRLGIARKPLLVVQNSTVDDVARSWRLLYPSAVVYVPQRADLEAGGRKRFLQRIATNQFDGIVIPQSFLKLIPDDPASEQAFLQEEIDRVEAAVAAAARQDKSKKSLVKRLNELRLRLEGRRLRQADRKKDNILSFDELGIDALFLDECHKYKRLGFYTSRRGIKGIDPDGSEDALSAMFKCRSVQARQGRVVLATGTPISNTMAEAWTMLRFIAPTRLDEARIATFDQFAGAFGQLISSFELTTTGQFKAVSRFARFVNVRQLSELYRAHVDVVLNDDIVEFQRNQTLPVLKNGGFTKIVLPQTQGVQDALDTIKERLRWFEGLTGSEKRENSHLPLVLFGQARKATLDVRLLSPLEDDDEGSKLNQAVTEIVRLYRQANAYKGTQLVFADVFQSPARLFVEEGDNYAKAIRFNLFDELKEKLLKAGIPADELAICPAEADKREAVFARVRTGAVRVMLGTSERMGIGVNVQERLVALHHLDAPNRPTDFEQRNGRIIRQGNLHATWGMPIEILTYGVDKTLDATAYGRLAVKQKFINQVLKGHLTDEAMNDVSADDDFAAMSFDQMMATLSGSQYALAYAAKQLDLSRLLTARKNWQRSVLDSQTQVERARRILSVQIPLLPLLESEAVALKTRFTDESSGQYQLTNILIDGVTYTEKFGKPVQELLEQLRGQLKRRVTPQAVLSVNGLPLTLTGEIRQDMFTLRNEYVFTYQWGNSLWAEITSGPGLFQSLRQAVAHAAHLPVQCQQRIDRARADEMAFLQRVNEPFRHGEAIRQLELEIDDLQTAMLQESEPLEELVVA